MYITHISYIPNFSTFYIISGIQLNTIIFFFIRKIRTLPHSITHIIRAYNVSSIFFNFKPMNRILQSNVNCITIYKNGLFRYDVSNNI